ncbi:hypothetical protein [Aeromicrobium sp. Leaf350]|uniref:hypothetical protein n=1 Tax=Aeromicrobium sp. Leaf350 TaxID=2876565 RepID=UPI001E58F726|nr:hypothetical protein [Aeromicrobium sp. Leaf350]
MIIDPQTFVQVEAQRRLADTPPPRTRVERVVRPRRHRHHRGPVLRLAAWATGRTAYI